MSAQHQQQEVTNRTTNVSDSYNTTNTVNRVFDNAGNTSVYVNSDAGEETTAPSSDNNRNLIIAAAVIAAALIIGRVKG